MDAIKGRIWVFGDNVDTDQIIPAERLLAANLGHLNDYIFEKVRPGFAAEVRPGDILVAGRNFGCGSSREHAPLSWERVLPIAHLDPACVDVDLRCLALLGIDLALD